jgi:ubiquinone/menaquinone biosynthesis C-methylase UbiE
MVMSNSVGIASTEESGVVDQGRLTRERDAHNKIFSEHTRESAEKFYRIIHRSRALYEGLIRSHSPGAHALEYGCGMGRHAPDIARHGAARVVGIDISDVAIAHAQEAAVADGLSQAEYLVMNAEELKFPDNSFDLICGTAILHHLDLTRAYAELARVLRPGGLAVFMEPLGHNPLINLYRRLTPRLRTVDEHPLFMRDIAAAKAHFGEVTPHFFILQSLAAVPFHGKPYFRKVLHALESADAALFRALPFTRRYAWQVILTLEKPIQSRRG